MLKRLPIHPFLFAIYPILALFLHNIDIASLKMLLYPVIVSLFLTSIIFSLLSLTIKNINKAALITSLLLLVFFSFGHLSMALVNIDLPINIARHRYTLTFYFLLFIGVSLVILKAKRSMKTPNKILNLISLSLILITTFQISLYNLKSKKMYQQLSIETDSTLIDKTKVDHLPDIYYFILDGYASGKTLKEVYNFDNSHFHDFLLEKGFYNALDSRSNYMRTFLSIASSMNMEYLDQAIHDLAIDTDTFKDRKIFFHMIQNAKTIRILKSFGYKFINVQAGDFNPTVYNKLADINITSSSIISEFSMMLVQTTLLKIFEVVLYDKYVYFRGLIKRPTILNFFNNFPDIIQMEGPKFTMSHILSPHPPFVFGPNGEIPQTVSFDLRDWQNKKGYTDEIIYLNKRLKQLVNTIISSSKNTPIIIMHADHGSGHTSDRDLTGYVQNMTKIQIDERTRIFNTYYMPENCKELLYPSITPVNTFRILLNCALGQNFDVLPDKIYWSERTRPYKLTDITELIEVKHSPK